MTVTTIPSAGIDLSDTFAFTGTVTGTPSDFVKISTNTITSAVGNTSFATISDTYKIYMVQIANVGFSAHAKMKCRVGTSSGYVSSNYRVAGTSGRTDSTAIDKDNKFTDSTFDLTGGWDIDDVSNETYNARVYFYNLRDTNGFTHMYCNATWRNGSAYTVFGNWSGCLPSTDAYTHLQFGDLTDSANMDAGTFTLYGLKQ